MQPRRRLVAILAGTALAGALAGAGRSAAGATGGTGEPGETGDKLVPDSPADQSAAFAAALGQAAERGRALRLAAGRYRVGGVEMLPGCAILGEGAVLEATDGGPILTGDGVAGLRLRGLAFEGPEDEGRAGEAGAPPSERALVELSQCRDLALEGCAFAGAPGNGLDLWQSGGRVTGCRFERCAGAAIRAGDSAGLTISENAISSCGDLGIYVFREEPGRDATILRANRIERIGWVSGGNGEVGNGINAFNTEAIVIEGNVIDRCAFSALRLNSTRDAVVSGNVCTGSGEVAVFVEFAFSGAVVSGNVIDDAAQGISITNFDEGGRLAVCTGNIVRNIRARSEVNPDTRPVGISAEADTVLNANLVENVPGIGIALGWGPYLRNVNASANTVREADIAIGVSVVEGVGPALVAGNLLSPSAGGHAIAGLEWERLSDPDLTAHAGRHGWLHLSGNAIA